MVRKADSGIRPKDWKYCINPNSRSFCGILYDSTKKPGADLSEFLLNTCKQQDVVVGYNNKYWGEEGCFTRKAREEFFVLVKKGELLAKVKFKYTLPPATEYSGSPILDLNVCFHDNLGQEWKVRMWQRQLWSDAIHPESGEWLPFIRNSISDTPYYKPLEIYRQDIINFCRNQNVMSDKSILVYKVRGFGNPGFVLCDSYGYRIYVGQFFGDYKTENTELGIKCTWHGYSMFSNLSRLSNKVEDYPIITNEQIFDTLALLAERGYKIY